MGHQGGWFRTVLVVEANEDLAGIIGRTLRDSGFVVTEVNTGREALDLLETQYPDAVILDPDLEDGCGPALVERCRQIRRLENQTMVWVVMADMDRAEALQQYGAPIHGFLSQPFDPEDLVKLLEGKLLGRTLALERYSQRHARHRARDNLVESAT